jgi:hypothetical protein
MDAVDSPRFPEVADWVWQNLTRDGFFWVEDARTEIAGAYLWTLHREGESWRVHVEVTIGAVYSADFRHLLEEADHWVPRLRRGEVGGVTILSTGVELRADPGS